MTEKIKYNLIGVISSLNECADFVRPVFESNGKYYFQYGRNGVIYTFKEIPKEFKNRITLLNQINMSTNTALKKEYTIGDDPVIALRLDKENYFLSDIHNFMLFIKEYKTDDEILKEEIDTLIDYINREKAKKKILKAQI